MFQNAVKKLGAFKYAVHSYNQYLQKREPNYVKRNLLFPKKYENTFIREVNYVRKYLFFVFSEH